MTGRHADPRIARIGPGQGGVVSPTWTVSSTATPGESVTVCERVALGTTARVALWPRGNEDAVCAAVDRTLDALDRQVSRFRPDSELMRAERHGCVATLLSQGAADALTVALAAACVSGGRVDPTVGAALCDLGYDRDFAAIEPGSPRSAPRPAPGWRAVRLSGRVLRPTPGLRLDLGATAKGLGCDRAASAAMDALEALGTSSDRSGVLISLGGDIAVAGTPPRFGWPVGISEDPAADGSASQVLRVMRGGIATSSVLHRRWRTGRRTVHHIVDPSTGEPVDARWRTATVVARTCVEANTASTAAIVAGDDAEAWLVSHGLSARLVDRRGNVRLVGSWPRNPDGWVPVPRRSIFEGAGKEGKEAEDRADGRERIEGRRAYEGARR